MPCADSSNLTGLLAPELVGVDKARVLSLADIALANEVAVLLLVSRLDELRRFGLTFGLILIHFFKSSLEEIVIEIAYRGGQLQTPQYGTGLPAFYQRKARRYYIIIPTSQRRFICDQTYRV